MNRALLEQEIAGSKAALLAHKNGIEVHEIVLKAFEAELAKGSVTTAVTTLPKEKDVKDSKK